MTDDREEFRDARTAGLRARHERRIETREELRARTRREVAEEIAEAIEELDRSDGQYDEFMVGVFAAARIAREIGAKE